MQDGNRDNTLKDEFRSQQPTPIEHYWNNNARGKEKKLGKTAEMR